VASPPGKYVGNALVVTTTHLKQGWLRRMARRKAIRRPSRSSSCGTAITSPTPRSSAIPVFLTEPMVRSNDYYRTPVDHGTWLYACDDSEQIVGRAPDVVPHYDFGKQPYAREYSERHKLPLGVAWTGAPSMYPGYAETAKNMTDAQGMALLSPAPGRPNEVSKAVDPDRVTARSTSCRFAKTSTCSSATAETSLSRRAIRRVRR
jgi:hypothetical protein